MAQFWTAHDGKWEKPLDAFPAFESYAFQQRLAVMGTGPYMREMPSLPSEHFPAKVEPMGVSIAKHPFTGDDWMFEPKLDGYRGVAYIQSGQIRILTRNGMSVAKVLPNLCAELSKQPHDMVLDGELVAFDAEWKQSFRELSIRLGQKSAGKNNVAFYCFDLLHLDGQNTRVLPYIERRALLEQSVTAGALVKVMHAQEDGPALYDASLATGLEGIVAKRKASRYCPGKKTQDWLKVKPFQTSDFPIVGYLGSRGLRALLVGVRTERGLEYLGRVAAAMPKRDADALLSQLHAIPAAAPAIINPPDYAAHWVEPRLFAEVRYFEILQGKLRHAVFVRMRPDLELM